MENELKIFTLGKFKVKNDDQVITEKRSINDKPWMLFKYLITEKDRIKHAEVISNDLWPDDDIKSPKHSITNLVYRLRKRFKNCDESYVVNTKGRCYFNDKTNYWLDIEEFIKLTKKAKHLKRKNKIDAIKNYKKAFDLYNGDFLIEIPYQEWVIPHRNNYHWHFVESVLEYIELLKEEDRYEEITKICEKAIEIEPYEEELHIAYLEALLKLGENAHARSHYKYANDLFNNDLDITSIPKLENFYKNKLDSNPLTRIKKSLKERNHIKGAFICKNDIFRMIYELEERRAERNNRPIYLSYIKFLNINDLKRYDFRIEKILEKTLRKGDIITRWDSDKYLILLVDIDQKSARVVLDRIKEEINKETNIDKNKLKYDFESI